MSSQFFARWASLTMSSCPVAERIARRGFYVPSGVALTRDQAEQVAKALREIWLR